MKFSADVDTLHWRSVHGVIVMKKYRADKTIGLIKNRSSDARHNQEESDSAPWPPWEL